jgi:hypothetical protein
MAVHKVSLQLTTEVLNKDVKFEIESGGGKLGKLLISKGNIEWVPKQGSVNRKQLTWAKFATLMEESGKVAKKAKKKAARKVGKKASKNPLTKPAKKPLKKAA